MLVRSSPGKTAFSLCNEVLHARFALQISYDDIVSIRTDGVRSASVPEGVQWKTEWNEPGEFVVKDHIQGPWLWPVDGSAMLDYVQWYNRSHDNSDEVVPLESFIEDDEEE